MKKIKMVGQKIGRLGIIAFAGLTKQGKAKWLCLCDCGTLIVVCGDSLRSKKRPTLSCGCLHRESVTTHGYTKKKGLFTTYRAWIYMKARCLNPNKVTYKDYGGRGITVCDKWLNSFALFCPYSLGLFSQTCGSFCGLSRKGYCLPCSNQ